jgi:D-sedoheptulose 7-phosphate isomerase
MRRTSAPAGAITSEGTAEPGGGAALRTVARVLDDAIALQQRVRAESLEPVARAAALIVEAYRADGKVLVFGNGGSAADAQHFAAELVGRFELDRAGMPAMALTTDPCVLTSVANDYGFDRIFARQIEALGRPGDVAVAISTSGVSPNVVEAVREATDRGLHTVALTGRDGGVLAGMAEVHINVPHAVTCRIQEVHMILLHAICEIVERAS